MELESKITLSSLPFSSHLLSSQDKRSLLRLNVFDLDHTLLKANSSYRFGAYLYRQRFFSWPVLAYCLSVYACHQLGMISIPSIHKKIFSLLFKGRAIEDIAYHVEQFLDQELKIMLYHPAIARLQEAQRNGYWTMILSSSPDFLVQPIAARLGVKEWKASLYRKDERGRLIEITEIIEGQGKADYVSFLIKQFNIPSSHVTVYSDSYLDLPLLKLAGNAIGVVPDKFLRRICLENGWEMI